MIQFTGSVGTGRRIGMRGAERMIPAAWNWAARRDDRPG